jgi:DNA modification methylase
MPEIRIPPAELVSTTSLKTDGNNPNAMTKAQHEALRKNIEEFGFIVPIIVNQDLVIADGQQRWEVARDAGWPQVPIIRLDIKDVDRRILRQVLNKLKGSHDYDLDIQEFQRIVDDGELARLGALLAENPIKFEKMLELATTQREDDFVVPKEAKYQVAVGDKFKLGNHTLVCGDSTKGEDMAALMGNEYAALIFTDPPYNVDYESPSGKIMNDAMTPEDYNKFIDAFNKTMLSVAKGAVYCCMSNKEFPDFKASFEKQGGHWSSTIIWNKHSFVFGRQDYHRKHEPIFYGWKEGCQHYWSGSREECDVWDIAKPSRNELHPTQKPIELVARALKNSSVEGDIVLDPFGGSGTTLIACEQLGRQCRMMELDPFYASVIVERWESFTGRQAVKA